MVRLCTKILSELLIWSMSSFQLTSKRIWETFSSNLNSGLWPLGQVRNVGHSPAPDSPQSMPPNLRLSLPSCKSVFGVKITSMLRVSVGVPTL